MRTRQNTDWRRHSHDLLLSGDFIGSSVLEIVGSDVVFGPSAGRSGRPSTGDE